MEDFAYLVLGGRPLTADGLPVRKVEFVAPDGVVVRLKGRISDVIKVPFRGIRPEPAPRRLLRQTQALLGGY